MARTPSFQRRSSSNAEHDAMACAWWLVRPHGCSDDKKLKTETQLKLEFIYVHNDSHTIWYTQPSSPTETFNMHSRWHVRNLKLDRGRCTIHKFFFSSGSGSNTNYFLVDFAYLEVHTEVGSACLAGLGCIIRFACVFTHGSWLVLGSVNKRNTHTHQWTKTNILKWIFSGEIHKYSSNE